MTVGRLPKRLPTPPPTTATAPKRRQAKALDQSHTASQQQQQTLFDQLRAIWTDTKNAAAYSGIRRLLAAAKAQRIPGVTQKRVSEFLATVPAYGQHRTQRLRFRRRKFISRGLMEFWQSDLADMSKFAHWNDGIRYLIITIDVWSKRLFVVPIKKKDEPTMIAGLRYLFEHVTTYRPKLWHSDKGSEYTAAGIQALLAEYGIHSYHTLNPETKASVAERVIRTLKGRIYRYLTANNTRRYVDVLQDIVDGYNHSKHRSIGMAPASVTPALHDVIQARLYPRQLHQTNNDACALPVAAYAVGDHVRHYLQRGKFPRGFLVQFTQQHFVISAIHYSDPPVYRLVDASDGEPILGTFYKEELVPATIGG